MLSKSEFVYNTIYMDAAASALKPESVISAEEYFIKNSYANSGRGICSRASAVDEMVAKTREEIANFINSRFESVVFTNGSTDGLNRLAAMLARDVLTPDSVVIVSDLDHNAARLPFEDLANRGKCKLWVCPLDKDLNIDAEALRERCAKGDVSAVVITAMSNVLGEPQNIKELCIAAGKAITIVDAAQYVAHLPIDVTDWGVDALVFSGHKIGANTGLGILYLKDINRWTSDRLGGGIVSKVNGHSWDFINGPEKFEAGTLPLTQIAGLVPAKNYLLNHYDNKITEYLYDELAKIPRIKIISKRNSFLVTFVIEGMHVLDFGTLAGAYGICMRVGVMCAPWLHDLLGENGTIRLSLGPWNTIAEVDQVIEIFKKIIK